jgi:hypothetical protein
MAKFEMIHEIFNSCSGNQMRDIEIVEVDEGDVETHVQVHIDDPNAKVERYETVDGTIIYDIDILGQRQRYSFTAL